MSSQNPSAERYIIQYFIDRMNAAGFDAHYGYDRPDLGRAVGVNNKPQCEIWLGDTTYTMWENNEYPIEVTDTIRCYVWVHKGSQSHEAGDWYDTCSDAVRALAHNPPARSQSAKLWWDNTEISINRTSPLEQWDGSLQDSAGFLCALIEMPITFLTTIVT